MKKGKKDTAIQHVDPEEEWIIPTGAREEFGFPDTPNAAQVKSWMRQQQA